MGAGACKTSNKEQLYLQLDTVISDKFPSGIRLNHGESVNFCTCGLSSNQPYCDNSHIGFSQKYPKTVSFRGKTASERSPPLCNCKYSKHLPYCDDSHKHLRDIEDLFPLHCYTRIQQTSAKEMNLTNNSTYKWCSCGFSRSGAFCSDSCRSLFGKVRGLSFVYRLSSVPSCAKIVNKNNNNNVKVCMCKSTRTPPYCDQICYNIPLALGKTAEPQPTGENPIPQPMVNAGGGNGAFNKLATISEFKQNSVLNSMTGNKLTSTNIEANTPPSMIVSGFTPSSGIFEAKPIPAPISHNFKTVNERMDAKKGFQEDVLFSQTKEETQLDSNRSNSDLVSLQRRELVQDNTQSDNFIQKPISVTSSDSVCESQSNYRDDIDDVLCPLPKGLKPRISLSVSYFPNSIKANLKESKITLFSSNSNASPLDYKGKQTHLQTKSSVTRRKNSQTMSISEVGYDGEEQEPH